MIGFLPRKVIVKKGERRLESTLRSTRLWNQFFGPSLPRRPPWCAPPVQWAAVKGTVTFQIWKKSTVWSPPPLGNLNRRFFFKFPIETRKNLCCYRENRLFWEKTFFFAPQARLFFFVVFFTILFIFTLKTKKIIRRFGPPSKRLTVDFFQI